MKILSNKSARLVSATIMQVLKYIRQLSHLQEYSPDVQRKLAKVLRYERSVHVLLFLCVCGIATYRLHCENYSFLVYLDQLTNRVYEIHHTVGLVLINYCVCLFLATLQI